MPLQTGTAKRARVDEDDHDDEESVDEEIDLDNLKSYCTPDILICGNCRSDIFKLFFEYIRNSQGILRKVVVEFCVCFTNFRFM